LRLARFSKWAGGEVNVHVNDAQERRDHGLERWEYEALVERGVLRHARVELLDGQLVAMSAHHTPYASTVERLAAVLHRQLGDTVRVRCQLPLVVGVRSLPQPELVVAPHTGSRAHPITVHLVIEVTESSRDIDERKVGLYARADVPVYWRFELTRGVVRVHEQPDPEPGTYRRVTLHGADDVLRVAALPSLSVGLADLLE